LEDNNPLFATIRDSYRKTMHLSFTIRKPALTSDYSITDVSVEVSYLGSVRISQNTSIKLLNSIRHLHFNRTGRNVEFALQPQHETGTM